MTYSDGLKNTAKFEPESEYPQAFGISFTPTVSGIICGIVGLLGFGYIFMNMIQPLRTELKDLKAQMTDKNSAVNDEKIAKTKQTITDLQAKIQQEKSLSGDILAFFSNEDTLDTLLLDINSFIDLNKAELVAYQPEDKEAKIINDSSLGKRVNGKLKRKSITVELQATYPQTWAIIRDIERLQPLLLVKDFQSELADKRTGIVSSNKKFIVTGGNELKTKFKLEAILPLSDQDKAAIKEEVENSKKKKTRKKGKKSTKKN